MILEYGQESGLISNIGNVTVVKVVEPFHEIARTTIQRNERSLVMRYVKAIFPNTAFECLSSRVLQ